MTTQLAINEKAATPPDQETFEYKGHNIVVSRVTVSNIHLEERECYRAVITQEGHRRRSVTTDDAEGAVEKARQWIDSDATRPTPQAIFEGVANFSAEITAEIETPNALKIIVSAQLKDGTPLPETIVVMDHSDEQV